MKCSFSSKTVCMTGVTSGSSEATAHLLAENGLSVTVSNVQADAVTRIAGAIGAATDYTAA